MACSPQLRIKQYFGLTVLKDTTLSIEEAKGFLANYWDDQNNYGIKINVEGKPINSFDELVSVVTSDKYLNRTVEVGLYLTLNR